MEVAFHYKSKNPTELRVQKFEKKLGLSLPNAFRKYLLTGNIGSTPVEDWCYRIGKPGKLDSMKEWEEALVDVFCSIKELDDNYKDMSSAERERGWLPNEMIAIGDGPGGNHLLICIDGEHTGKVYFWANDLFETEDAHDEMVPGYNNICFVANNFDEFIEGLYIFEDD